MEITQLDYASAADFNANCPDELKPLYFARVNGSYSLRPITGLVRATALTDAQRQLSDNRVKYARELAAIRGE